MPARLRPIGSEFGRWLPDPVVVSASIRLEELLESGATVAIRTIWQVNAGGLEPAIVFWLSVIAM